MHKLRSIYCDVQMFHRILQCVKVIEQSGMKNEVIFNMAAALHLAKLMPTSSDSSVCNMCNFKDFDTSLWLYCCDESVNGATREG